MIEGLGQRLLEQVGTVELAIGALDFADPPLFEAAGCAVRAGTPTSSAALAGAEIDALARPCRGMSIAELSVCTAVAVLEPQSP